MVIALSSGAGAAAPLINRGVWETLWAALLRCDKGLVYGWGSGDREWLDSFKDAARKIAGDERAPLHWRARFAVRAILPFISLSSLQP
jgi:hypothetical protein